MSNPITHLCALLRTTLSLFRCLGNYNPQGQCWLVRDLTPWSVLCVIIIKRAAVSESRCQRCVCCHCFLIVHWAKVTPTSQRPVSPPLSQCQNYGGPWTSEKYLPVQWKVPSHQIKIEIWTEGTAATMPLTAQLSVCPTVPLPPVAPLVTCCRPPDPHQLSYSALCPPDPPNFPTVHCDHHSPLALCALLQTGLTRPRPSHSYVHLSDPGTRLVSNWERDKNQDKNTPGEDPPRPSASAWLCSTTKKQVMAHHYLFIMCYIMGSGAHFGIPYVSVFCGPGHPRTLILLLSMRGGKTRSCPLMAGNWPLMRAGGWWPLCWPHNAGQFKIINTGA